MAVTGHGLLDDSLDFYYATYNVDFKKPSVNGLRYDELENIMDDIPARKKLIFIDACHSGALDKDALKPEEPFIQATENEKVKAIGSRSTIIVNKNKVGLNGTYELMQNLFADLSNSSGTTVISAAGGLEYAFESAKWNNGVFTYCIRNGLEQLEADANGDKTISLQELSNYVSENVTRLTNGRQKPNARQENLEFDWAVK
jgi:hypothetical protein